MEAAKIAVLNSTDYMDVILSQSTVGAFKLQGIKNPVEQHKLVYDAN